MEEYYTPSRTPTGIQTSGNNVPCIVSSAQANVDRGNRHFTVSSERSPTFVVNFSLFVFNAVSNRLDLRFVIIIESSGLRSRTNLSEQTAGQLVRLGEKSWLINSKRPELIEEKGKGKLCTFCLKLNS